MDMDLYAALGLEKPEEPAGDGGGQGGAPEARETVEDTGREVADPAAAGEAGAEEGGAAGEGQPKEPEVAVPAKEQQEKKPQSKAENARFAQARRKAETEEAVRRALEEQEQRHKDELKALFRELGVKGEADKPVETLEEFRSAAAAKRAEELAEKLRSGEVNAGDLKALLGREDPEVAALREKVRQMEAAQQRAEEERRRQDFARRVEPQLEKIREYDPAVQSLEDLPKLTRAKEFYAEVKAGKDFLAAYETVYRDEIEAKKAAAVRQETINRQRGKEHLSATSQRGSGSPAVPPEELRLYRQMMPGISDEEIRRHYARFRGQK